MESDQFLKDYAINCGVPLGSDLGPATLPNIQIILDFMSPDNFSVILQIKTLYIGDVSVENLNL